MKYVATGFLAQHDHGNNLDAGTQVWLQRRVDEDTQAVSWWWVANPLYAHVSAEIAPLHSVALASANGLRPGRQSIRIEPLVEDEAKPIRRGRDEAAAVLPAETVAIPTSADQAAMMILLGVDYLRTHAPERLRPEAHMPGFKDGKAE